MLGQVHGDKTVILISGGWPLDDRDEVSTLSVVAGEARLPALGIFTIYVPTSTFSADRRVDDVDAARRQLSAFRSARDACRP